MMTVTRRRMAAAIATALLGGCAAFQAPTAPQPAPPPTISIARLYEQPAERAFINGMRFYEDGQYERAEVMFKRSLAEGLRDRQDVAAANKHLAFIACAYSRPADCEAAFRAAFGAEPGSLGPVGFAVHLVAAVAAVVQFKYGWDESPAIPIAIDGRSFAFTVQFVGGRSFLATARTDAVAIGSIS